MKISRLDTVVSNYVSRSTNTNLAEQTIYVLQDISTTLAMLYDKMFGETDEEEIPQETVIIPFDELHKYRKIYIEFYSPMIGYEATFSEYKSNEKLMVFEAFGGDIAQSPEEYGKTWRCWTKEPTVEQKDKSPWGVEIVKES